LEIPEPEWVLEDFIQAGGLTVLHGVPGAGKSLLAQDWSLVVNNGWEWCGRETKRSQVLYIMGEGQTGLRGRLLAWLVARNTEYVPTVHWIMEPVALWANPAGGFTQEQIGLLRYIQDNEINLVVADTLSATFGGGNENMQQDMNQYLKWFKEVMSMGSAAVIVHHESKSATGSPRGSTVLAGAADTIIRVEPVLDSDGETMKGCTIRCKKQKDGMPFSRLRLKLESYAVDTDRGTSVVLKPQASAEAKAEDANAERVAAMLDYIRSRPGISWNGVVTHMKGRKSELMAIRDELIAQGMMEWGPDQKGLYPLMEGEDLL
jgi:hypothetical protein